MGERLTVTDLRKMKANGEEIAALTAYDYPTARILDESGVDILLVGDSLGMVLLGYESTLAVTMEDMIHHTRAVARGARRAMVVGDMPFLSYQISPGDALRNAGRFLQEAGAQAVKLEGGRAVAETVRRLTEAGIPVMGHLGLTPQSVNQLGGYKVQGKNEGAAARLLEDARCLEESGAFAIVLEMIPRQLAELVTARVAVPTIGIGAGSGCDGQILVSNDMLGLYHGHVARFVKKFADLSPLVSRGVRDYVSEVKGGAFPGPEHSFTIDEEILRKLQ